ncbi:ammonium transporter [Methylomonas sp. MED-D]|uniref:Ammonium transporter n=1 Tax=Methylomonas koyamae TaxID=702114 RepID=A0A177PF26_9GAMM|nr:ammonium transporter [Methylomonas koyamae]NJA05533.1 ammonium transporter [Methylococcaceae bacterium WWC4]OAI28019.1 ammonia channel protein [Methylomonas koyamae]
MTITKRVFVLTAPLFIWPAAACAEGINQANTAWVLTSTALVLFMTIPGLSLFYGGLVRSKNVLSVLMQCFAITCLVSLLWLAGVYSLVFADGGDWQPWLGGAGKLFLPDMGIANLIGDIPETVYFMFQMTFAIITPALIVGAFAERMKFSAMLWFSALWLIVVYMPICHWMWGNGWLAALGAKDFAGGIVIHVNAGVASLVSALVIGNRKGFPTVAMPPHNMTMVVTGAGMLWFGWFGFNGGSALKADGSAGMAIAVTHIAAAAGSLTWMTIEWRRFGKPSVLGIVTGMVAGLGTITPASGFVGPIGGLVIGIVAGIVCFYATQYVKRGLKIDDSLDVFPVHGVGGCVGSILTGVFAAESFGGLGLNGVSIAEQVGVQALAVLVTIVWSAAFSYLVLKLLDKTIGLRVSEDEEVEGLDIALHEETGYHNL